MDDQKIVDLFFERSEQAIAELAHRYGALCTAVATNILNNAQDAEECVNDAYLGVWNTVPPTRPNPLRSYVCRLVRNLAIKKYHMNTAIKRNSHYDVALDELENCLSSTASVEDEIDARELARHINDFLATLNREQRVLFVRRYWFADSIDELAVRFHTNNHTISVRLFRLREKLIEHLTKEEMTP